MERAISEFLLGSGFQGLLILVLMVGIRWLRDELKTYVQGVIEAERQRLEDCKEDKAHCLEEMHRIIEAHEEDRRQWHDSQAAMLKQVTAAVDYCRRQAERRHEP